MNASITALLRRIAAAAALLALIGAATLAAPASAQDSGTDMKVKDYIQVKTDKTAAVVTGDTAWVTVSIRGKENVDDVRFTATLSDGSVAYPTNTVDHSGPYNGYRLDEKETDYVAFQLTIPAGLGQKSAELTLSATWTFDGVAMSGTESVKVPLVQFEGEPYSLVSDAVTFSTEDPAAGWVSVSFAGLAPRVEGFQVTVSDPGGLDIYYPLETFTSLAGDDLLEDGETDVVRFRMNESQWDSPVTAELEVRYTLAGVATRAFHTVTIAPA